MPWRNARMKSVSILAIESSSAMPANCVLAKHHYFGNVQWAHAAPGLKTVEDALTMRRNVLSRFEQAERESDPRRRRALLTFVIVGGGPTGVELAGAVAELAKHTLKHNFRSIDPATAEIVLVEATDRVLSAYPPELSAKAEKSLQRLGATVHCDTLVKHVAEDHVVIARDDGETVVPTCCVLWAAGVTASRFGGRLAAAVGAETDRSGRIYVEGTLTLPGHKEIFVCGDLAHIEQEGQPLPGLAPVAMQQGAYAAKVIRNRLRGKTTPGFHYRDWGMMAVIGRAAAVAQIGPLRLGGFLAWVAWLFIHLINLVEFENRVSVLLQWGWNYITRNRSARIITNDQLLMQETTENRPLDRGDGDRRARSTSSSCQGPC